MCRILLRDDRKFRERSWDYAQGIFCYISAKYAIALRVAAKMRARVVKTLAGSPGYLLHVSPSGSQHFSQQRIFLLPEDTAW